LDLESEQIRLVKSEILAGSVTIQFTTQPSDPQEIFIVPATAPFIVVIDGSPLVALGRRCSGCNALSLGDVSHGRSEEFYCACNHLNANSDRVQMLNERHPLICAAVLELDRRAKELIPMIESLPFTAMTPSKDLDRITAHRNTLSIYRVAECDGCGHVMAAVKGGKCTNCKAEWSGDSASVIQATPTARGNLNERLLRTLEKAMVTQSPAWVLQQELFISKLQMLEIQQNEVSHHFSSYPFVMKQDIIDKLKSGLPVVSAVSTNQKDTIATIRSTLELVEKSISTTVSGTSKPPYTPLAYLSQRSGSEPWVSRIQHQQQLVKAVTAAGMRTVMLAAMLGRLVIIDSNQDCITGYVGASETMSYIAKSIVLLKSAFATIPHTAIHEAAEELKAATTNQQVVYIEASMLVAINPLMLKMIQAFIPKQVHEKLALRYKDVKSEMVFWVQYIGYVFEQDHSNAAALRDRDMAGLKLKMLAPMQPGTSVLTFKAEYETNVINYER
jgi:predicted Zn-ribbon and HTH transcriptional regulator